MRVSGVEGVKGQLSRDRDVKRKRCRQKGLGKRCQHKEVSRSDDRRKRCRETERAVNRKTVILCIQEMSKCAALSMQKGAQKSDDSTLCTEWTLTACSGTIFGRTAILA